MFLTAALTAGAMWSADLFRDDFSHFPPGWLTNPVGSLNAAIQEYHYLSNRGVPLGPWANAICHLDAWMIGDEEGHPYLENQLDDTSKQWSYPIFLTGDAEWSDYSVEVKVKPLNRVDSVGLGFRYHTNRHYYYFSISGGKKASLALHLLIYGALISLLGLLPSLYWNSLHHWVTFRHVFTAVQGGNDGGSTGNPARGVRKNH